MTLCYVYRYLGLSFDKLNFKFSFNYYSYNMETVHKLHKKKPKKIDDMSKEQIRRAIMKKRQCETKAQAIVESLLETSISEDYFLKCLFDINQSHLDDVIEERSIIHLCGYPLCVTALSAKEIPIQKYRISIKTNKVYDITSRKNFCSNKCYESCMYVKKQMLTSPLWFREYEDMPQFHLLSKNTAGKMGQEIDVSIIEKIGVQSQTESPFTSINEFTRSSLLDIAPNNSEHDKQNVDNQNKNIDDGNTEIQVELRNAFQEFNISKESSKQSLINLIENTQQQHIKPSNNCLNIVGEIVEKTDNPILSNMAEKRHSQNKSKKVLKKKQLSATAITIEVEKCLAEWFTLDTMVLLFGEEKVKEMVADKGECIRSYMNNYAKSISYNSNSYDQYQALCRKLNLLELEDKKSDSQMTRETKPLPDYSILQEESKRLQLKVKAFYSGTIEIPEPNTITEKTADDDENLTKVPLVDKNAQNALRRNIVCDHLNKVLPDLLRSLGLLTLSISADVRFLVNTFKLKANNIMFKPIQWTLIAIIIIKLLSLRCSRLKCLLEQQTADQHMQLLLLSYNQDGGYLDRLISWLTDVDRLLDTNDTHLTNDNK